MMTLPRLHARASQSGAALMWGILAITVVSACAGVVSASLMRRVQVVRVAIERGHAADLRQAADVLARVTAANGRASAASLAGGSVEASVACDPAPRVVVVTTARATGERRVTERPGRACP